MMDPTLIGTVAASITAAKDILSGLASERDSALIREKTSALMEQLLKAQEGLLAHNTALLQLQNEHFKASQELRELKETVRERDRYPLVNIGNGHTAYRVNVTPHQGGAGEPGLPQALHYLCQLCADSGVKAVLQPVPRSVFMQCPRCRIPLHVDKAKMFPS